MKQRRGHVASLALILLSVMMMGVIALRPLSGPPAVTGTPLFLPVVNQPGAGSATPTKTPPTLALDASTPTAVTGSGNLATVSFAPPVNSVIVVAVMSDEGAVQNFSVTDNLAAHLTYHNMGAGPYGNSANDGRAQAWWATNGTGGAMTITLLPSQTGMQMLLRVLVFTGAEAAHPIGAVAGGQGITGSLSQTYTSTMNRSWGWALYVDWNQKGVPAVPAGETIDSAYDPAGLISAAVIKQNAVTASAGSPVRMSTLAPNAGTQITWMYFEILSGSASDTQSPTVPTGLAASPLSASQIHLAWNAASDNIGVAGYKIYRGGAQVGATSATSYVDSGLAVSTTYTYTVSAYDTAGNESGQSAPAHATTPSVSTNVAANAAIAYQTMDGVGTNVNSWAWKGDELQPALNALVDTLGYNIFRVVHDRMEWAGGGPTRPATVLAHLRSLDSATLQSVYEVSDMQDLWNTIGYLNSKGIAGKQIIVNFMGWTAPWMGGSGAYGSVSHITDDAQTNQDIATMIASLVYYGHHRRDVSGTNQNLSFSYVSPLNEADWNGLEGPQVSAAQMNTIYGNILTTLNTMSDTTTLLMGPDTALSPDGYTDAFSAAVRARMAHFSWHNYSGSAVSPAAARNGINADWMTETSKWCSGCDNNQPPGESEWSFGAGIGDILLGDIQNGYSAVLSWEGFDTFYYHHNSYSAWGHVGCTQNGSGCTISDGAPRLYNIRGRAWPEATLATAIRPGMVMRALTTTVPNLTALAFYDTSTGQVSIVGHNANGSEITIGGELLNFPALSSLALYETNASLNRQHVSDVPLSGNQFATTIPADTFFSLTATAALQDTGLPTTAD